MTKPSRSKETRALEAEAYPAFRVKKEVLDKLDRLAEMLGEKRTKVFEDMLDVYLLAAPVVVAERKKMEDVLRAAIVDQMRVF